jgi:Uma2 family endonuclease
MRTIELPEPKHVPLVFDREERLDEAQYLEFCRNNPDLRCERTAEGKVVMVPPAGLEGAFRSGEAFRMLGNWARNEGRGQAFDSSSEFILPDGSALSPDASWVSDESLSSLSRQERKRFPHLSPEFVIEVMSPSDRLKTAKAKMELWIANGVQLAWLIDGDHATVYVYRKGKPPIARQGIRELAGEGPLKGFVMKLASIWRGLR